MVDVLDLDQTLCTIKQEMASTVASTIANSICNALKDSLTPLCDDIRTLGNGLDVTTADATTFASTIRHKISKIVTPLRANINTLRDHLDAIKDEVTALATNVCQDVNPSLTMLCNNLTTMEACLGKCLDDVGSHQNHIIKTLIPKVETKVSNLLTAYNNQFTVLPPPPDINRRILALERGQRAAPPDPAHPIPPPTNLVSVPFPVPVPALDATKLPSDNRVSISLSDMDTRSRVCCMLGSVSTSSAPNHITGNNAPSAPTVVNIMGDNSHTMGQ
jgi:hypothetical protein